MSVLLVFIDGIGFGREGAANPFDGSPSEIFAPLGGHAGAASRSDMRATSIDATLGHAGLPQSATGQATLYTGRDAIAVAGGHRSAWPTGAVVTLVKDESLFAKARNIGISAGFLNVFDDARAERYARVFRGDEPRPKRFHMSASTIAALAGGEPREEARMLSSEKALHEGRAATFDLTAIPRRADRSPKPREPWRLAPAKKISRSSKHFSPTKLVTRKTRRGLATRSCGSIASSTCCSIPSTRARISSSSRATTEISKTFPRAAIREIAFPFSHGERTQRRS